MSDKNNTKVKFGVKQANLTVGETVRVKGKLGLCRYMNKPLMGEALERYIQGDPKHNINGHPYEDEHPHYKMSLVDASILDVKRNGKKPVPTDAQKVIACRMYDMKEGKALEINWRAIPSKKKEGEFWSKVAFGKLLDNGKIQVYPVKGKEFEGGTEVVVTYIVYEYEYKGKKGLTLGVDNIVFTEEPKLWVKKAPTLRDGWVAAPETDDGDDGNDGNGDEGSDGFVNVDDEDIPFADEDLPFAEDDVFND